VFPSIIYELTVVISKMEQYIPFRLQPRVHMV